ncbi:peptide/nickel transport system permease protein [Comamonas sp. BIGb0124]|uniref:ABC transporter permease n=1 Tax=Comamonas sp. BIGb0124 TaxID=2485130 RepID=UPI000F48BAAB|nr:ABC transporter permease [Comamonas sp. BIGb0124]ROR22911.1 peptide/nickel transport system permease protein [Comamonas sp. BIGb0124]
MLRYIVGRVLQAVLVLWAAYTVTYLILYVLPGDTLVYLLATNDQQIDALSPEELQQVKAYYGLTRGPVEQYFVNLTGILSGDFGTSATKSQSVNDMVFSRLPSTALLGATSVLFALILGLAIAITATYVRWRPLKVFLSRLPVLGVSLPSFWVGLLLIQLVAFNLGWLPSSGSNGWKSLILPSLTMSLPSAAMLAQVLIRSLEDTMREPFIQTAKAKGISHFAVYTRHALKNAALPTLTILGLLVGATVTGAVTTETVFSRVGIGRLAQEAVLAQDIPVVLAIVVIAAAAFVLVNLVVDLLYLVLDPRVRHSVKVN